MLHRFIKFSLTSFAKFCCCEGFRVQHVVRSRVLTVLVCYSSGKDLLQATKLVDVPLESTFRDVLRDLPGDFADRTLQGPARSLRARIRGRA
jgi:hypothetical protein